MLLGRERFDLDQPYFCNSQECLFRLWKRLDENVHSVLFHLLRIYILENPIYCFPALKTLFAEPLGLPGSRLTRMISSEEEKLTNRIVKKCIAQLKRPKNCKHRFNYSVNDL